MNKSDIKNAFLNQKVLIIGDVMIDSYIWGKVDRISPEAPVPVVNVKKKEQRLGGAANVALNIQSLGGQPLLCAIVGRDTEGEDFLELLRKHDLKGDGIISSHDRITTIKHRVISGSQHILRVDQEIDHPISATETSQLIAHIKNMLDEQGITVVVFEDYDKGVITERLIKETVALCKSRNIPTIVDPKKRNFQFYREVTLMKPNLKELREGLKRDIQASNINEVQESAKELILTLGIQSAFITLSEHGVLLQKGDETFSISAHKREITDVSGAGDTVVSVAALCLGSGLEYKLLAELSNLAGGIVCEKVGVVPIFLEELLSEASLLGIIRQ